MSAMGQETPDELAERLRTHVDRLAGLIGPRPMTSEVRIEATVTYIERELTALGLTVEREWYEAGTRRFCNLVANCPGEGRGRAAREVVLLGAHYDTVSTTPGADDNASAVAVLIEAARLLREHRPRRTMRFVAFAAEEPPYFHSGDMGSQQHALGCRKRGEQVRGMLCLEMVGYFSDVTGSQQVPDGIPGWLRWAFPKRGNFLAAVGNLRSWRLVWGFRRGFKRGTRLPLFSIALPEAIQEIRLSDNSSFWDQGYPALMLTDTSFLRNPHYHKSSDRPETLDYGRMAQVALGTASAMRHLAGRAGWW